MNITLNRTSHINPGAGYLGTRPGVLILCTFLSAVLLSSFLYLISSKYHSLIFSDAAVNEKNEKIGSKSISQQTTKDQFPHTNQPIQGALSDVESCLVSNNYPPVILQWCGFITSYANQRGLPSDLVAAMILQESGGNPLAYSNSGAVGLMQIMPRDGIASSFNCVNGPCFGNRPTTQELQNPEYNIAYGTKLLAGLYHQCGDMREALKSYGPKDVGYFYADKVFHIFNNYSSVTQSN